MAKRFTFPTSVWACYERWWRICDPPPKKKQHIMAKWPCPRPCMWTPPWDIRVLIDQAQGGQALEIFVRKVWNIYLGAHNFPCYPKNLCSFGRIFHLILPDCTALCARPHIPAFKKDPCFQLTCVRTSQCRISNPDTVEACMEKVICRSQLPKILIRHEDAHTRHRFPHQDEVHKHCCPQPELHKPRFFS